jgi:hypothetical protein
MDNDTLLNVVNAAVGIIGYFGCRPTGVRQTEGRILIDWDHWGKPKTLVLDSNGHVVRDES